VLPAAQPWDSTGRDRVAGGSFHRNFPGAAGEARRRDEVSGESVGFRGR